LGNKTARVGGVSDEMNRSNRCDNCNRMLNDGDRVTVIIPNVEVTDRYMKDNATVRLKLSPDAVEIRSAKIYCRNCLDYSDHFLEDNTDET